MNVGESIVKLLSKRNLKQVDFAKKIGKTPAYVNLLLRKSTCNSEILDKIAKVLEVPITYFYDADIVEDEQQNKCSKCKICKEKEQVVSVQKEMLELQKGLIAMLRANQVK